MERENHRSFAAIQKNIFAVNPSAEFKQDVLCYLQGYNKLAANRDKPVVVWTNLYNKMMWAMHHIYKVDLATLSRQQIYDDNLPCQSIAQAVDAGLLPYVRGAEELLALL